MRQLDQIIKRLVDALPKTLEQWRRGADLRSLKDIRIDHLGSVGTRLMLEKVRIQSPDDSFIIRASSTFPSARADNIPQQRRIFAYSEYAFCDLDRDTELVEGRMLREHGFQGLRMWQKGWLRATTLPVNHHVDRSVCAEFQVFNELCDLVHQHGLADSMRDCGGVSGSVRVLVSTTPCLSCICAVLQFSLLFPNVILKFGCVQPWHSEGGADGAMRETGAERVLPAVWEGGRLFEGGAGGKTEEQQRSRQTMPVVRHRAVSASQLRASCSTLGESDEGAAENIADGLVLETQAEVQCARLRPRRAASRPAVRWRLGP